jgi:hypothetical protein
MGSVRYVGLDVHKDTIYRGDEFRWQIDHGIHHRRVEG